MPCRFRSPIWTRSISRSQPEAVTYEDAMITDIIVKEAGGKGKGVFALRDFASGEFIFRRRHGQVVSNQEISSLSEEDQRHLCELDWERSAVLLVPGCYLNHACDPN